MSKYLAHNGHYNLIRRSHPNERQLRIHPMKNDTQCEIKKLQAVEEGFRQPWSVPFVLLQPIQVADARITLCRHEKYIITDSVAGFNLVPPKGLPYRAITDGLMPPLNDSTAVRGTRLTYDRLRNKFWSNLRVGRLKIRYRSSRPRILNFNWIVSVCTASGHRKQLPACQTIVGAQRPHSTAPEVVKYLWVQVKSVKRCNPHSSRRFVRTKENWCDSHASISKIDSVVNTRFKSRREIDQQRYKFMDYYHDLQTAITRAYQVSLGHKLAMSCAAPTCSVLHNRCCVLKNKIMF